MTDRVPVPPSGWDAGELALLGEAIGFGEGASRYIGGWVRDALGDRWQGFADNDLQKLLEGAGLTDVRVRVGARTQGDPFVVLLAVGTKPKRRRVRS